MIAAHLLEAAEAKAKPKATATESSSEPSLVQPVQSSLSAGAVPAKPPCRPLKDKRVAKDGTPWPENFDSLSQPDKVCWLMEHDPTPGVKIQLAVYRASLKPEPEEEIDVAAYIEEEDEVTRRLAWLRSRGIVIEDTRTRLTTPVQHLRRSAPNTPHAARPPSWRNHERQKQISNYCWYRNPWR